MAEQQKPIIREWTPIEGGGFLVRQLTDEEIAQANLHQITDAYAEDPKQQQVSIEQLHADVDELVGWCESPTQAYFDAEQRLHTALDELAALRAAVLATREGEA